MLSNAGFYYPENGISPTPLSIVFLLLSPNRRHQRGTGGRKEVWGLDFNSGYSRSSEVGAKGWWLPDQRNDQFLDFRLTHILLILLWFLQQSYNKLHVFLPPRILEWFLIFYVSPIDRVGKSLYPYWCQPRQCWEARRITMKEESEKVRPKYHIQTVEDRFQMVQKNKS